MISDQSNFREHCFKDPESRGPVRFWDSVAWKKGRDW